LSTDFVDGHSSLTYVFYLLNMYLPEWKIGGINGILKREEIWHVREDN